MDNQANGSSLYNAIEKAAVAYMEANPNVTDEEVEMALIWCDTLLRVELTDDVEFTLSTEAKERCLDSLGHS